MICWCGNYGCMNKQNKPLNYFLFQQPHHLYMGTWGVTQSVACERGVEEQTADHIVLVSQSVQTTDP